MDPSTPATALIVDDEPAIRDFLERTLKGMGFETFTASSGEQALEYLQVVRPQVILMDINLSGRSGMEVLPQIHQMQPNSVIIMLSAVQDDAVGEQAHRAGARDYLTKPVDIATLRRTLKTHLFFL